MPTMTKDQVMTALKKMGTEATRKTWARHGATGEYFGVKIGDMKTIEKKVQRDHKLARELFASGNCDAMYLAGLIADENAVTMEELRDWAEKAPWRMISEYTVPWVAAESPHGMALALEWIESPKESVASSGWSTLASLCTIIPDDELDVKLLTKLLKRVEKQIKKAPNRVKYTMNGFLTAAGQCVAPLTDAALAVADKVGKVEVDMGDTECKVHQPGAYLRSMIERGMMGRKKKRARC
jgi:3-methyladenine DNA glycosylase AlkD